MKYLKLMRVKHYLKNFLVFLPIMFSGYMFNVNKLIIVLIAFLSFSFVSSMVYILNDMKDVEKDRKHPKKKFRPLASGEVSMRAARVCLLLLFVLVISMLFFSGLLYKYSNILLVVYLLMNIAYSFGLKNIPLVDVTILTLGFLIRVLYGGFIIDVDISNWLFLTIMSVSFYMALGKRRNELMKVGEDTRGVLKYYNRDFLDKNMYIFLALAIVFYSLWSTMVIDNSLFKYSVIFVILIFMKYSMNVENDSLGDPIDVIFGDKILMFLVLIYAVFTMIVLYV